MDALSTDFGFKGEALSSISVISWLEVVTKIHGRKNGYREDGKWWKLKEGLAFSGGVFAKNCACAS